MNVWYFVALIFEKPFNETEWTVFEMISKFHSIEISTIPSPLQGLPIYLGPLFYYVNTKQIDSVVWFSVNYTLRQSVILIDFLAIWCAIFQEPLFCLCCLILWL
jgi:hypothetical protein